MAWDTALASPMAAPVSAMAKNMGDAQTPTRLCKSVQASCDERRSRSRKASRNSRGRASRPEPTSAIIMTPRLPTRVRPSTPGRVR